MPVSQTSLDSTAVHQPVDIRAISTGDVFAALSQGASDFWRHPSHYLFLALIYPLVGIALAVWSTGGDTFALLYPLAAGFALIGPIAGLGLYELSRRREQGLDDHPRHAASVLKHPALGSMLAIGLFLALVFIAWLAAASGLYSYFLGHNPPEGIVELIGTTLTTEPGLSLLVWGNLVGLAFALLVLATTGIAFPLLIDKGGSAAHAMATSLRAFRVNALPMLVWGAIVAVLLVVASIPLFVGLAVALPILGHTTWHLYRKMVP